MHTKEDANELNTLFCFFHDSVLKEICFDVGFCIEKDFNMKETNVPISKFIFQRIYEEPAVIEMEFKDVIHINIHPKDISCILEARLH